MYDQNITYVCRMIIADNTFTRKLIEIKIEYSSIISTHLEHQCNVVTEIM